MPLQAEENNATLTRTTGYESHCQGGGDVPSTSNDVSHDQQRLNERRKDEGGRRKNGSAANAVIDCIQPFAFRLQPSIHLAYLEEFGTAERKDLDKLLLDKLSSALSDEQKINSITNLLQKMRRDGVIRSAGPKRKAIWSFV